MEGTRELIVTSNYIVIYQISDKTIDIITQFVMRRQMNEGSSGKSVLCFMDSHYSKFEKLNIPITIRHSFEYLDFIVCSFKTPRRDRMVIPIQNTELEHRYSPGHFA